MTSYTGTRRESRARHLDLIRYVVRRVSAALVTIFVAITMNFMLFRAAPGNAGDLGHLPGATQAARTAIRHQFGLDQPVWQQYFIYVKQMCEGNMGISLANFQPVSENLRTALINTLPLVAVGTALALLLGFLSGILAAWHRARALDHTLLGTALVLYSVPAQWLALMLIAIFRNWLPSGGMSDPFAPTSGLPHYIDLARHMILPSVAFALTLYGQYTIIVRSSLLETFGQDYILSAKAKGLTPLAIIRRHALRNAMLPVSTVVALSIGYVVAGSILIETVFSWPGIGRAVYEAVLNRDYPMLEGAFLVLTASVVLCNLVADVLYLIIDPRVVT